MRIKRGIYIMLFLIIIISISFVSAGILDDIKKIITGKAAGPQPQNLSINVLGSFTAIIEDIQAIPDQNPLEASIRTVSFYINVSDPDGVWDIIDEYTDVEFSRGGVLRQGSCSWIIDMPDGYNASYLCSVDMWYYDDPGVWNIKINATDTGSGVLVEDTSTTFTYLPLGAMVVTPATLIWPSIVPLSTNQMSNNDPTVINNTGNYDGVVSVIAFNLTGETVPSEYITASNFTVGTISTGGEEECSATQMDDEVTTAIAGSNSNRGPGPDNYEELYYCIPNFPNVSSQTYSTDYIGGSWYIVY